jgi:hypothetical protein
VVIHAPHIETFHYVNREAGITAVSGTVFRGGEPVGRQIVRVRAEELARASIAPHPSVAPDERAALGGRPAVRPPAIARRPVIRANEPRSAPSRGEAGPPPRAAAAQPPRAPGAARPLIVRREPQVENPSFKARQDAMQSHPGRPLEPQQMKNLRDGKPAGPPHDQEVPTHPPKAAPRAPPKGPSKEPPRKP